MSATPLEKGNFWTADLAGPHPEYRTVGYIRAIPICGRDFCDSCGDCLACYGSEWHLCTWVVYQDKLEKFLADHPEATVERRDG